MLILQGIPVSPGVAVAEAVVIDNEGFRIPRRFVSRDAVDDELSRLQSATDAVAADIASNRDAISKQLGEQYGAIFSAHLQMLRDPKLHAELEELIRDRHYCPEYAVSRTMRGYAKAFQELDDPYLAERAHDIFDLEKRLLRNLLGRRREELSHITTPVIVLAQRNGKSGSSICDGVWH
jgi:phosphotransferase system enzyme I (PtsI)